MKIKETVGEKAFNCSNVIFMCFLMVLTFYPMYYILMASFSSPSQLMAHEGLLLVPLGFSFASFIAVFNNPMIITGYLNTIFVVVFGVIVNMVMTSLGAYFLSRRGIMLQKLVMFVIIFTMFFSGGLIPFFLLVKGMKLTGTLWALIIPGAISTFNLIIMRTAFMNIPSSLEESAKIDGAGHFTILTKLVLPLSLPTVAVLILYYGVAHWNAWFHASIFLNGKRDMFPLQLVLREILISNNTSSMSTGTATGDTEMISETIKYAVIIVATVPILALYPFLQRYFVKGIMVGAVKG